MLKIRLQRTGRKHEPTFRLVLTDSKNSTKSGRFLEILGSYDARDKNTTAVKEDRVKYWISKGAQPSDTVHNFLVDKKIIEGEKRNVLPKKSPIKKESDSAEATSDKGGEEKPAEEAPATEGDAKPEGDTPTPDSAEATPDKEEPKEDASAEVEQSETKEEAPAEDKKEEEKSTEEPKEEEKKEE